MNSITLTKSFPFANNVKLIHERSFIAGCVSKEYVAITLCGKIINFNTVSFISEREIKAISEKVSEIAKHRFGKRKKLSQLSLN